MFLGIICCRADFHVLFICCTRLTPRSPIPICYPNHGAAALPVATECRPSGNGMKQKHNMAVKLYCKSTEYGCASLIDRYKKTERNYFCGMEKFSRKRSITRLPPGGSSVAHCHFPRPPVQNPSERSVPWKPHPHATPFYTVECTCKLVTNYIFHNPLFGPKSTRGLLLRAGLSLS